MEGPKDPHVAVLTNRVTNMENSINSMNGKLDVLLADKAARDGQVVMVRLFWGGLIAVPGWALAIAQWLRGEP
jgi:hypothetical protein